MPQSDVQQIEENIRESKKILELHQALERLHTNRDFRKVIAEGYFRDEAVRLVHLKSDPSMGTPERQAAITKDIDGIGALSSYFRTLAFNASLAQKAVEVGQADLEEMLAEEGDK